MMAKAYSHKYPWEVYWLSREGKVHSQYFSTTDKAEQAIKRAIEHNKQMGYLFVEENYNIRPRIPIERKRKK